MKLLGQTSAALHGAIVRCASQKSHQLLLVTLTTLTLAIHSKQKLVCSHVQSIVVVVLAIIFAAHQHRQISRSSCEYLGSVRPSRTEQTAESSRAAQ